MDSFTAIDFNNIAVEQPESFSDQEIDELFADLPVNEEKHGAGTICAFCVISWF